MTKLDMDAYIKPFPPQPGSGREISYSTQLSEGWIKSWALSKLDTLFIPLLSLSQIQRIVGIHSLSLSQHGFFLVQGCPVLDCRVLCCAECSFLFGYGFFK